MAKVTILRENLAPAINVVSRFVAVKSQLPVLAYMYLKAEGDKVQLQATDLSKGISLEVPAKGDGEMELIVLAKTFNEVLSTLRAGEVELEVKEGILLVRQGEVRVTLQMGQVEEFPKMTLSEGESKFLGQVSLEQVESWWGKLGFSLSKDDARPVLLGTQWELGRGRLVATDGFRLSLIDRVGVGGEVVGLDKLNVPGSLWQELAKLMNERGFKEVDLYYLEDSRQLLARGSGVELVGNLVEGDYPKYEAIIPKEFGLKLAVDAEAFRRAIRTAAIFARDTAQIIKVEIGRGGLLIKANAPQVGGGEIEVEAEGAGSVEMSVAFNSRYLQDLLGHFDEALLNIGLNEPLQPVLFWGKDKKEFAHLIMPVRVREA